MMMILTSCAETPKAVISEYCSVHDRMQLSEKTINWLTLNKNDAMVALDIKQIAKDRRVHDELC